MSLEEKRAYLSRIHGRYRRAGKEHKGLILDEFTAVCGYDRKYALRLLNRPFQQTRGKPGPKQEYGSEVLEPLKKIWLAAEQICSKRLKQAMPLWLKHCPEVDDVLEKKLVKLSPATIDRLLKPFRSQGQRRRWPIKPGSLLKREIPIRTSNQDIETVGYLEADTVAHGGGSMAGDFIWSVTFTDIISGWTEVRAVWNRSAASILEHVRGLEEELAFGLLGFDSDNGSEFINHGLQKYFTDRPKGVKWTRSRPYHKNDNAHVEQKNWTMVRQLFGYERMENPAAVELMNKLYREEWSLLQNFYSPSMKLKTSTRVGSRYKKTYDEAQTPYERLLARPKSELKEAQMKLLAEKFGASNPFKVKERIERGLRAVLNLNRKYKAAA
jgi:transposase InsO family protein